MNVLRRHTPGRVHSAELLEGSPLTGFTPVAAVPLDVARERVGFLAALISDMAAAAIVEHWNPATLELLGAPATPDGEKWQSRAYKAAAQAGLHTTTPDGVFVASSRVRYMAREEMARSLRAAVQRDHIVRAVAATWFDDDAAQEERDVLLAQRRELLPQVSWAWVRNIARQVRAYKERAGTLPANVTELEDPPVPGAQVPLGAGVDRQLASFAEPTRDGRAGLNVLLPITSSPASREDWCWHQLTVAYRGVHIDRLRLPTLRVVGDDLVVDLCTEQRVPAPQLPDTTVPGAALRTLGVDWGVRRLFTARVIDATAVPGDDGLEVDASVVGAPVFIDPYELINHWHRLRVQRERLDAKAAQLTALINGRVCHGQVPLPEAVARRDALTAESKRVTVKQGRLGTEIANITAALLVAHALAAGAHQLAVEDLATLEPPRYAGKPVRTRVSQQMRSKVLDRVRDLCAEHRIRFIEVNPAGTSAECPCCGEKLTHTSAPNGGPGYAWASCDACGYGADRDVSGATHVGVRAAVNTLTWQRRRKEAEAPATKKRRRRAAKTTPAAKRQKAKPKKLAPARVRLGRSDLRLPRPAPHVTTTRGTIVPPHSRRRPGGTDTAGPHGTPSTAASGNAATTQVCTAAVGAHSAHNVSHVLSRDGCRFAYRAVMRATPVPAGCVDPITPN